jgi:SAM-dependent methyltransferase
MEAEMKKRVLSVAGPRTAAVVDCPLCGSARCLFRFRLPDRLHGVPGEFTYRRCSDCRTVFQDPRVIIEDLPLCYPDKYFTHQSPDVKSAPIAATAKPQAASRLRALMREAVIAAVRREPMNGAIGLLGGLMAKSRILRERAFRDLVIDELLPFKPGAARALEVGCGAGQLLKTLAQIGWQAEGVEWDEKAAEIARRTSGRPVMVGDFQNTALPLATYDLVVLHHVIEHLPDTRGCLRKIADILAPGGRVVLIYPNVGSLGARIFREDWYSWEVPRHLVLPSSGAIRKAAGAVGLFNASLKSSTSPRDAPWWIAYSRRYRRREPLNLNMVSITFQDRLFAFCERALTVMGLKLGEELIIVFEKPQ